MSKIRIGLAVAAALLGAAGAVACGGGATPAPTHSPTLAPTARPTLSPTTPATTPPTTPPVTPTHGGEVTKPVSVEERNAVASAQGYLTDQHFSRKGLIDQLKYEKYSTKAATAAVDSLHMDWNEQAALTAQDYLSTQPFSRGSMIEQLRFDGFTTTQANYGAKKAGL